jgi:hypothetical protein
MDLAARFPADSAHKRECYIFKILGQIYTNLGCFEILERRIGGAAGKPPRPHTKIGAGTPPYDAKKKNAYAGRRMEETSGDALSSNFLCNRKNHSYKSWLTKIMMQSNHGVHRTPGNFCSM